MEIRYVAFILFMIFCVFMILTKRGRNSLIKTFLGDILKDYGNIGTTEWGMITIYPRSMRLLLCKNKQQTFYVLEVNTAMKLKTYISVQQTALDLDTTRRLISFLEDKDK